MEPIFENKYICTKEYYKEYYRNINFENPIAIIIYIILGIGCIIGILSIIFPYLNILDKCEAEFNIAIALFVLYVQMFAYFRNKSLAYNRDMEINKGNPIERKIVITENESTILISTNNNISVEFKNIKKVMKTKNYYILISKSNITFTLKKDGFTKGTAEQFEKFLKQKRILK